MNSRSHFAVLGVVTSALLCGCGGSKESDIPLASTTTFNLNGVVIGVGAIQGATVCLDKNDSLTCDSGEPQTLSNSQGEYTLADITTNELTTYPIIANVSSQAIDLATPTVAIQKPYTLITPIGKHSVISPLTSLVAELMRQYPLLTPEMSAKKIAKDIILEEQGDILLKSYQASSPAKELARVVIKNISDSTEFFNKNVPKEKASVRQAYTLSIRRMLNWIPKAWQFKDYTTFGTEQLMTSTMSDFYDIDYLIKNIPQRTSKKIDEKSKLFTVEWLGANYYQQPNRRLEYREFSFQKDVGNVYSVITVRKSIDANQQATLLPSVDNNRYYLTESGASLPTKSMLTATNYNLMGVSLSGLNVRSFYSENLGYFGGSSTSVLLNEADAIKTFPNLSEFYILQQMIEKMYYTYDVIPLSTANNLNELKQTGVPLISACGNGGVTLISKEENGKVTEEALDNVGNFVDSPSDGVGDIKLTKLNADGTVKIEKLVNRQTTRYENESFISRENKQNSTYLTATWQQSTIFGHPAIVLNPPTQCPNENKKIYVELDNHIYAGEIIPMGTVTEYPLFNQTAFDAIKAALPL